VIAWTAVPGGGASMATYMIAGGIPVKTHDAVAELLGVNGFPALELS
jgi:hypothetical protein